MANDSYSRFDYDNKMKYNYSRKSSKQNGYDEHIVNREQNGHLDRVWFHTWYMLMSLQWRHNGRDSVSNHQPRVCLLNNLFKA